MPDRIFNRHSSRAFRTRETADATSGPRLIGYRGAVASHHHQSALAAYDVLNLGGNAVDAGVAAVLVEGVVNPHMHGPAGECPILIAGPDTEVTAVNGNTCAPAAATPEAYLERGFTDMPSSGLLAAGVPASLSALITALHRFGTLPFHVLVEPAAELARNGFAMHEGLRHQETVGLNPNKQKFSDEWPSTAAIYLENGEPIAIGAPVHNHALANVYELLAGASRSHASAPKGYDAVRQEFYHGSVATQIEQHCQRHDGLITAADLANFSTPLEHPLSTLVGEARIFKCSSWCQGPALLQTLQILKQTRLNTLEHNSTEYLHILAEATKLAYADREQYYADPQMVDVPLSDLLSNDYARLRASLIDPSVASPLMQPGDPVRGQAVLDRSSWLGGANWGAGTVHVDVADRHGMIASFTPSGGWLEANAVIPELGFPLGNRLMTFYLTPEHHPNRLAPGKRPRTTISPSLVTRDSQPWIAFGSMGGDQQDQWMLQFFLNVVVFGMTLQQAIDAPKVSSEHFDGFFAPHDRFNRRLRVENQIDSNVIQQLSNRGHEIDLAPMWTEGYLNAVSRDPDTGALEAAVDPRGARGDVFPATALAW
ncbi:MAG: gamma-glutamyltransferase family protein [Gammaproteobacteria bacterium]